MEKVTAPVAAPPVATVEVSPPEPSPPEPPADVPKKGPLARLAEGVSDLFSRVTGKKPPEPNQTMEIAADDILDATAPPPIPPPVERVGELFARVKGKQLPPDQTMEIAMDDLMAADTATPPPIPRAAKTKKTKRP